MGVDSTNGMIYRVDLCGVQGGSHYSIRTRWINLARKNQPITKFLAEWICLARHTFQPSTLPPFLALLDLCSTPVVIMVQGLRAQADKA